jgi:cyanophycinase-like exopeptidase
MAKKKVNETPREGDQTYRARLTIGSEKVATITIRAQDDADAKEQLERSKPPAFDGMGSWSLTKLTESEVE